MKFIPTILRPLSLASLLVTVIFLSITSIASAQDPTITKSVIPTNANSGDTITFTLTFSNAGSSTATGVVITDILPISVTNASVISSGVTITDTNHSPSYVWQVQDLAQNEGGIITITGVLSNSLPPGILANTASITTTSIDTNTTNNNTSVGVAVNMNYIYLPLIFKHIAQWQAQTSPTANTLNGIDCPSNTICFAVSEGHQVVQTNNGSSWSIVNLSTGFAINGIDCLDTSNCIGAGDSGVTINTSNGSNWSVTDLPSNTHLYGADYPNAGVQYWVGDHGRVTRLLGGAINNVTMCDGCSYLRDITCSLSSGGTCTSVGLNGEIYYTTTGWASWAKATPTSSHLYGISCPSDSTCYAVGANGTVLKGSFNSSSWSSQSSGTISTLKSISCPDTTTCFAAGTGGTIITTHDGGATWSTETSGTTQDLNGISCPTSGKCFAVGAGGTIMVRE